MAEEQKTMTKEERAKMFQARQERKESLAKQRDTRVVFARTRDTEAVLNIIQPADRALNILRRNAGLKFSFEDVSKYVDEFKEAVIALNDVTEKMCKSVDISYRVPVWIKEQKGGQLPPSKDESL